ncbi:major tail protein [Arthrobacter phage Ingrid]|nr:major tail protein [Arthrobacter phage Ingrid]QFG11004.1 major tail protein [Arthrobacter phage Loretta]
MGTLYEDPNDPGTYLIQSTPSTPSDPGGGYDPTRPTDLRPTKLTWGTLGERFYEAGTDRGVLYVDGVGYAWNGLVSVNQTPSGGEPEPYYLDGIPYVMAASPEEFKGSIEAYTYPKAFEACDGSEEIAQGLYISQQNRKPFGFSYRTLVGNDIDELDHGYKVHIVYEAMASPSNRNHGTLGDNTDPTTFSWNIITKPVKFEDPAFGIKYGAHLTLDSREVYPWAMAAVEDVLYGTEDTEPRLPTPQEIVALFADNALLKITDNGDGTWTAEGPDSIISMIDANTFQIDWPSAVYLDENTYNVSSL